MDLTLTTRPLGRTLAQRKLECTRATTRRDLLRSLGLCINASLPPELLKLYQHRPRVIHGVPVPGKGGRCQRCADIHAKTRGAASPGGTPHIVRELALVTGGKHQDVVVAASFEIARRR